MVKLTRRQLEGLKQYKYSGVDKSLLSQAVLTPYWNNLVKLFPKTIAPNTITLTGLSFVCLNVLTLIVHDPEYTGKYLPRWVYWSWSIGLFAYQSMDAIDGKQARRTGMAGPLGEMFDHGCDAINTGLEVALCQAAFGFTRSWWTPASLAASLATFYLSTWEEYHTGTLYLSAFSGPVEGILLICIIYALTALFTPAIWQYHVLDTVKPGFGLLDRAARTVGGVQKAVDPGPGHKIQLGLTAHDVGQAVYDFLAKSSVLRQMTIADSFMWFAALGLLGNVINGYWNVYEARVKAKKPVLTPLLGLLPFLADTTLKMGWLLAPNVHIVDSPRILVFMAFWCASFAYQVSQLILAHVTKSPFPYWNWMVLWTLFGSVDANATRLFGREPWIQNSPERVRLFIIVSAVVAAINYMRFAKQVIWQITDFTGVACFTVRHKDANGGWVENDEATEKKRQ